MSSPPCAVDMLKRVESIVTSPDSKRKLEKISSRYTLGTRKPIAADCKDQQGRKLKRCMRILFTSIAKRIKPGSMSEQNMMDAMRDSLSSVSVPVLHDNSDIDIDGSDIVKIIRDSYLKSVKRGKDNRSMFAIY